MGAQGSLLGVDSACRLRGGRVGDGESVSLGVSTSDAETAVPQDSIEDILKDVWTDDEEVKKKPAVEAADAAMAAGDGSKDVAKEASASVAGVESEDAAKVAAPDGSTKVAIGAESF